MKALLILVIALTGAMTVGATSYAATGSSYLSVLNQERASRGVAPLHTSADLVRVAQSWDAEMARTGDLRHNPQLESDVPNWWAVGENVGFGDDLSDLAQAFWNSPVHRANILDPRFTEVGVATLRSGGRLWITVVFRKPWHQVARHVVQQVRRPQTLPRARDRQPSATPSRVVRCLWLSRAWTLR